VLIEACQTGALRLENTIAMVALAASSPARQGPKNGLVELDLISRPRFRRIVREHGGRDLVLRMIAFAISIACLAVGALTMPALASQCASPSEIAASRTRWAGVRKQFVNTTDHEMACRVFAASFYESVMTRYAAVACARDAERDPDISALNSEINAFNDLLAAKCGS
jgi:hypothetical protein